MGQMGRMGLMGKSGKSLPEFHSSHLSHTSHFTELPVPGWPEARCFAVIRARISGSWAPGKRGRARFPLIEIGFSRIEERGPLAVSRGPASSASEGRHIGSTGCNPGYGAPPSPVWVSGLKRKSCPRIFTDWHRLKRVDR
jgi:hypothetical protein